MLCRVARNLPVLILTFLGSAATGRAATEPPAIVHVDLMDPSTGPSFKGMMIKADQQSVKVGPVTFVVSNVSRDLVHEMIVVSVDKHGEPLPCELLAERPERGGFFLGRAGRTRLRQVRQGRSCSRRHG